MTIIFVYALGGTATYVHLTLLHYLKVFANDALLRWIITVLGSIIVLGLEITRYVSYNTQNAYF